MIQDTPNSEDFIRAGKAQFDFAWDIVVSFLKLIDEVGECGGTEHIEEFTDEFWEAAKQRVHTALAIAQQGVELILKGRIVRASPYLLIAGSPSHWPKPQYDPPLSFSDFRTIDAQDLIKTHNLFCEAKLNEAFIEAFDLLRKLRNRVMHTVDRNIEVSAMEVITSILEMHNYLIPGETWVETRREYLLESPESQMFSSDGIEAQVSWEFFLVYSLLNKAQVKKYFGINKKQRSYICPGCKFECENHTLIVPKYAVLRPNKPDSSYLYCQIACSVDPL